MEPKGNKLSLKICSIASCNEFVGTSATTSSYRITMYLLKLPARKPTDLENSIIR